MKSIHWLLAAVLAAPVGAAADLTSDLRELKGICDAGLLTESECAARRQAILAKHDEATPAWFCNYTGKGGAPALLVDAGAQGYSESASASMVVKEIIDEAGLMPNFIVRPANVSNAAASVRGTQRYVEYNPSFVSQLKQGTGTNWAVYSVMAHEVGHHLQGHTLIPGGSRPPTELEADEYSGFILARLGATLVQSQAAMNTFGSDPSAGTHPPTAPRLDAIKRGWERGRGAKPAAGAGNQADSVSPFPKPSSLPPPSGLKYTDSCQINGEYVLVTADNLVLSRDRGFMQVGERAAPLSQVCAFDLLSTAGRYCVRRSDGAVFAGSPVAVGQCLPCVAGVCQ